MTKFLEDILRQPTELRRALAYLRGDGRACLEAAVDTIRQARRVYFTGIGASWNAVLAAGPIFHAGAQPVHLSDASELLVSAKLPAGSVLVVLSRSGRSIEIVKLLAKAREAGATVVAITNFEDGVLAMEADIAIVLPVAPDHGISVNTYSTLVLAAGLFAVMAVNATTAGLASALDESLLKTEEMFPVWQRQLASTGWIQPGAPCYFLARGSSMASANAARLLWEEGAKSPATAMTAGSFRHGPQEIVTPGLRVALWIDPIAEAQDLALARDLLKLGCHVLLIGHDVPTNAAELVFQLPSMPAGWQFLVDVFPMQLAAERLAAAAGEDCDSFRFASYIVQDDWGLSLGNEAAAVESSKDITG